MTTDLPSLPVFVPALGGSVQAAVHAALEDGWLGLGPLTQRFEAELSAHLELGVDRALMATSSGTAALHLACLAAGAGPGTEVIMPSFTYVAGHQAVRMAGAEPVLCDIEEATLGADPASVERLVGEHTRAVMVTHYAGVPCDLRGVAAVCERHGLRLIEDAAHAFGTRSDSGEMIGAFGDLVCFSFGPVKTITTLEGGAIVTPHVEDLAVLHEQRLLGVDSDTDARYRRQRTWDYDCVRPGFRYHLGSIPAAVGLAQLSVVDRLVATRRATCQRFSAAFGELAGARVLDTDWVDVAPFIYALRVADAADREPLMAHLRARGIGSTLHWIGAHMLTEFKGCRRDELPVTEAVSADILTLPLHPDMAAEAEARVVEGVGSFLAG